MTRCTDRLDRAGRNGFTLIELLAVIAIISLLAALLLPAVSSAKRTAESAVCLNNYKQMAAAQKLWSSDNSGGVAGSWGLGSGTDGCYGSVWIVWDRIISAYLGVNLELPPAANGTRRWIPAPPPDECVTKIFFCPSGGGQGTPWMKFPVGTASGWTRSYALNRVFSTTFGCTDNASLPGVYHSNVPAPAQTLILGEQGDITRGQWSASNSHLNQDYGPQWHRGKNNYLFVDGHAAAFQYPETWGTGSYGAPKGMWTLDSTD